LVQTASCPSVAPIGAAALAAILALEGCQALVDLDGLADGTMPGADGGFDALADGAPGDVGSDETTHLDAAPDREVTCPAGTKGEEGVAVYAGAFAFCIDRTEVTNEAYAAFLASEQAPNVLAAQPAVCGWNDDFTPTQGWPFAAGAERLPVTFVDWCDARAYCVWAGKRLCGAAAGGPLLSQFVGSEGIDQWYQACSAGGARRYPYGADYVEGACNVQLDPSAPHYVGEHIGCEGGPAGVFDMSGSVWEWIDSCFPLGGDAGPDDACSTRGGAFDSVPPDEVACGFAMRTSIRAVSWPNVGFRCCVDVP
jgi:formylglycine-generating enzyme required for sulfatase activity